MVNVTGPFQEPAPSSHNFQLIENRGIGINALTCNKQADLNQIHNRLSKPQILSALMILAFGTRLPSFDQPKAVRDFLGIKADLAINIAKINRIIDNIVNTQSTLHLKIKEL